MELDREIALDDYIEDMAALFKVLGDTTRTKILACLEKGELNVTDISNLVGLNISAISLALSLFEVARMSLNSFVI